MLLYETTRYCSCENPLSNPLQGACSVFPVAILYSNILPKAACYFEHCSESWP
jgi:hypothetical protein